MRKRLSLSVVALVAALSVGASPAAASPADICTDACWSDFLSHVANCVNSFQDEALKTCLDGAKATLDACLAACARPKPQGASLDFKDASGFLPPINDGALYTVGAVITDPSAVVQSVEFHVFKNGVDSVVGTDSNGINGWSVTFDPVPLNLGVGQGAVFFKVRNTSGDNGVAGDAAPVRVYARTPALSMWGIVALSLLMLSAALVLMRRRTTA